MTVIVLIGKTCFWMTLHFEKQSKLINSMTTTNQGKRGGKRPGAGRKKGAVNKLTKELKALAGEYTEEAIQTFVDVMRDTEVPAAIRVAAADKLLDRSHGKPPVFVDADVGNTVDQALLDKIQNEYMVKINAARERQRQVLIERGIIEAD